MSTLYPLKFKTIYKDKIWGGQKIRTYLNKDFVVTLRLDSKIVVGPTAKQSNSSLDRGRGPEFESRQGMVN